MRQVALNQPLGSSPDAQLKWMAESLREIERASYEADQSEASSLYGILYPIEFGAVGGTANDTAAFGRLWKKLVDLGGATVQAKPLTYRHDLSAETTGFVVKAFSGLNAFILRGGGATFNLVHTFAADEVGFWLIFTDCAQITVEDITVVSQNGHLAGEPVGFWTFALGGSNGCGPAIFRNINFSGGRVGIDFAEPTLPNNIYNKRILIENVSAVDTFYPVVLNGAHSAVIRNLRTTNAGRSIYATNVEGLDAELYSTANTHDSDVLITANAIDSRWPSNRVKNVTLRYSRKDSVSGGAPVILRLEKSTGSSGAAEATDITLNFDVDAPCGHLFEMYRSVDLAEDFGVARGHVVDGVDVSGRGVNLLSTAGINIHAMPVGETIRNVVIHDLIGRTASNDFNITVDGTAFDDPLVLRNVDIDGNLSLANFAAGMVRLYNVISLNFKTSATPTLTWSQMSGTAPALGDGTLTARYEREGATVRLDVALTMGSTTTYGDGSNAWTFSLPSPYDSAPRSTAIGTVLAVRAGAFIVGAAQFDPGTNKIYLYANGGSTSWRQGTPGAWANGDTITFSVSYDV